MWQNLELLISIRPFDWLRFEVGAPNGQPDCATTAIWLTVGPMDISLSWGI